MTTDFDLWAAEIAEGEEVVTVNCVCGHPESQHAHFRQGNDCVVCGCMNYRAPVDVAALAVWVGMSLIGVALLIALIA